MAYTVAWDESVPSGATDARFIDDRIRDRQTAIRERLADLFGGLTLLEWQGDPLKIKGIRGNLANTFSLTGGLQNTQVKDGLTGAVTDLTIDHLTGDTTVRRDLIVTRYINAAGGFRTLIEGWKITDVAANVAATEIVRPEGRAFQVRGGSILSIGVVAALNQFVTSGALTVEVWKSTVVQADGTRADVATGLTVQLNTGTNKAWGVTTQAIDADTFAAGDELFVKYSTNAPFLPAGSLDFQVVVEVET